MKLTAINLSLQNRQVNRFAVAFFIVIASVLFFSGVPDVPFHPDESTLLYMSSDFEQLFTDPLSMVWQPNQPYDQRMQYRLLDAPLTRYLLGISRQIAGVQAPAVDWDWSKTWQENERIGALPSSALLFSGRWMMAIFFPFCLVLIFLIGVELGGSRLGWLCMIFLATNALVLVHTRRAMAESPLLFTLLLSLVVILKSKSRPWLAAIPIALAFCTKQSSAPLILIGLAAIFLYSRGQQSSRSFVIRGLLFFLLLFALIYIALNPFTWVNPVQSTLAAFQARQELVSQQVSAIQSVSPEHILSSLPSRLAGVFGNLYFTPPAVADVANYLTETQSASHQYLTTPINTLFRDFISGTIFLVLCLAGFIWMVLSLKHKNNQHDALILILLSAIAQWFFQLISIPLSFQRYVIPLVPFTVILSAFTIDQLIIYLVMIFKQKSVSPGQNVRRD